MRTWGRWALGLLLLPVAVSAGAAEPKRVLIIHSFGRMSPPFTTASTAFQTTLTKELGERVALDEVAVDMASDTQSEREEPFVAFLLARLAKEQPDLVVPIGSAAGLFVAKHRDRIFPRAPVIYTGMDRRTLPADTLSENATFVGPQIDLAGPIDNILRLVPDTNNIVVVIGASPLEAYWTTRLREAFEPFTNRVRFTWLNDLSFDEVLRRVAALPPRSFVLLALLIRDASGVTHNQNDALQELRAVARAPINSLFLAQLGQGIVGGRLYQFEAFGSEAARVAIRVLRGESITRFPPRIIEPSGPARYDWRELQRWKISEDRLPAGSLIEFRQATDWERYRWWLVGALIVGVVQGALILQLGFALAKRRRAQISLRESEARFRTVADSAPVLIWMAGVDKQCTFFNRPWLDFTGRTAEQELGNGWLQGVHPDDVDACLKAYGDAFEARRSFVLKYRLRRHDGEYRWIADNGVPRYDGAHRFAGYIGSCSDITERLRAEERFRQVFEAAPNAMIMVDGDGRIVLSNAQVELVFGYSQEELLGLPIETLIPDRLRRHHPERRGRFTAGPSARQMGAGRDLFGRRKNGSEVPVEVGLNPIRTSEGLFVVASVIDITERKRVEAETQSLRQELAHISRVSTMGELTAAIVHELNQPLAAILTNAQAALRSIESTDQGLTEMGEILRDIVADNRRAHRVIESMRSLFHKGVADRQPVALNTLISDVVSLVLAETVLKNVSMTLDLAPRLPLVSADRVQLQQVILNLVINAFDALSDVVDGPREVLVRTRAVDWLTVRLDVIDTGTGIPADALESIFEPFVTTKRTGMGMGLSVSRSIVTDHGGKIWAENNTSGGSTFHIELPALPADEAG